MRAGAALAAACWIPAIFGIDAVHGNAKVAGATVFPHGIAMGSTRDAALVSQEEQVTASELVAMGISMSFSPDSDVGQDERWGRTYESFGEDPTLVSQMVAAAVSGYQQPSLGAPGSVLACAKHLLGAGGTTWGTGVDGGIDQGDTQITEAEMRAVHLPPFQAAVSAGAMAIMVSYSSWNGTKMSASAEWLTTVLKGELGYKGFLLFRTSTRSSSSPATRRRREATAINAGLDMIMMSKGAPAFISDVESLVAAGTIPQSRIDDAVTRILRAKVIAGLFGASPPTGSALSSVGSAAHRQVARQAVRESMVLLQNNANPSTGQNRLPLSKSAHVFVAGPGANDVGVQSGGWTLSWQGVTETLSAGIGGTTILAGLQSTASSSSLVTYQYDGSGVPAGTDVGVVVLYREPLRRVRGRHRRPELLEHERGAEPLGAHHLRRARSRDREQVGGGEHPAGAGPRDGSPRAHRVLLADVQRGRGGVAARLGGRGGGRRSLRRCSFHGQASLVLADGLHHAPHFVPADRCRPAVRLRVRALSFPTGGADLARASPGESPAVARVLVTFLGFDGEVRPRPTRDRGDSEVGAVHEIGPGGRR